MQQGVASSTVDSIKLQKEDARRVLKTRLKGLTKEGMASESSAICHHLRHSMLFTTSATLGLYLHCARLREVDTSDLVTAALHAGKTCYAPVVDDKSSNMRLLHLDSPACVVEVPPFGILEPSPSYGDGTPRRDVMKDGAVLDLLLMPGLGFDSSGRRLGRGGGYYDKMLTGLQRQAAEQGRQPPLLVALAYSVQMMEDAVPVDSHDQSVDAIVTAAGIILCSEAARSSALNVAAAS
ncbi:MAG: hypothetical protein WDW36_005070 [Sanguina aurantia]